jgi:hypothetical protein
MKPFSTISKRLLLACSLVLVTACGSNGITDPTADKASKSGYLTVSAAVNAGPRPASTTAPISSSGPSVNSGKKFMVQSGYNVPAQ